MPKNIEKEYSFIVDNGDEIEFPQQIYDFLITQKKKIKIVELNYEKTQEHDKFRNAGVRVRKIKDNNNEKIELTYKQYLGTKDGINNFLEITENVPEFSWNIFLFDQINNLNLTNNLKGILLEMNKFCGMKPGITIENTKNLYYYTCKNCILEVADEKIKYILGEKIYMEKMLEIEIISDSYDSKEVKQFVGYFFNRYKLTAPSEGKSERGKKILLESLKISDI